MTFSKSRALELCEQAEEDDGRMTPGPWATYQDTVFDPIEINSPSRDIAELNTWSHRPDEREPEAIAIARTRNNLRELSEMLRAAVGEVERLQTNRDHTCTCPHQDASEPLANHDKACPIRVNRFKRIAPEVALDRLATALSSEEEIADWLDAKARYFVHNRNVGPYSASDDRQTCSKLLLLGAERFPSGSNFNLIECARDLGMQPFAHSKHTRIVIAAWRFADREWRGGEIGWGEAMKRAATKVLRHG